jgi:hypothetical protein
MVLHADERNHGNDSREHDGSRNSGKDVIADVLHLKETCAQEFPAHLGLERILQTEAFFVEIARNELLNGDKQAVGVRLTLRNSNAPVHPHLGSDVLAGDIDGSGNRPECHHHRHQWKELLVHG